MVTRPSSRRGSATRVLIVDDHAVVREGIRHVLTAEEGFEVVGEAATGEAAVELCARVQPDVVVLDLTMPGMSGLDAAPRLRALAPDAKLLVLSMHDHQEYVTQSMRAGAAGYLRKDSSPSELRGAIRTVHAGGTFFTSVVAQTSTSVDEGDARIASLTSRERGVLREIAKGATSKEIAAHLGISVRTVESHRESLARKLSVKGAASLTRFAIEHGLL
ncbi:MAG: response regulator [Gemmatimonadaceae bacterium]